MPDLSLSGIEKSFGSTSVLNGVSLDILDGEFISLVGPSGCGKSTLLRIIAGLETQDAGTVRIAGQPVEHLRAGRRNLAMVFQSYALYPHLSVFDNMAVPLRMRRLSFAQRLPLAGRLMPGAGSVAATISDDIEKTARLLGIEHLLDRKPGQLSGGQRQRVAVGRAIVREPHAFLMDEPLSNLDAKLRIHMRSEIAQLHRRLATTFVYVTHDQAEAMTMSDRIAVMLDGDLIQVATPDEIYRNPVDLRVAEFIGSPKINVLPGKIGVNGRVNVLGADMWLSVRGAGPGACCVAIRPENMTVAAHGDLVGRVAHIENLGSEAFVHVAMDGLDEAVVVRTDVDAMRGRDIGVDIGIAIRPEAALIFATDGSRLTTEPVEERAGCEWLMSPFPRARRQIVRRTPNALATAMTPSGSYSVHRQFF